MCISFPQPCQQHQPPRRTAPRRHPSNHNNVVPPPAKKNPARSYCSKNYTSTVIRAPICRCVIFFAGAGNASDGLFQWVKGCARRHLWGKNNTLLMLLSFYRGRATLGHFLFWFRKPFFLCSNTAKAATFFTSGWVSDTKKNERKKNKNVFQHKMNKKT